MLEARLVELEVGLAGREVEGEGAFGGVAGGEVERGRARGGGRVGGCGVGVGYVGEVWWEVWLSWAWWSLS